MSISRIQGRKMAAVAVSAALLALACPVAAQIMVLEPPGAAARNNATVIEGSTASFGAPYYGERVEGELLFFDVNGCKEDQYLLPSEKANNTDASPSTPIILMIRRGGCNFVNKVKIAQRKGAKAVIVADAKGSLSSRKDVKKVIVSDDGWGESVKIPSLLLSEEDANFLISAGDGLYEVDAPQSVVPSRNGGRGNKTVILELVWSLPKDHAVQVDVWTTPSSTQSTKFVKEFAAYAHAFKDKIDFQPHYWVMSMARDFHEMCTDATADFCAFDPDFGGKTTGKMVLQESVRQMCLWETTKALHPKNPHSGFYSPEWWMYMETFPDVCPHEETDDEHRFSEVCSYKLMEKLQVNTRQVKKCYEEKFNTMLAHELVNRAWAPNAIIINKTRYSGSLDAELVTRAICTAFATTQPECENFIKNGQLIMMEGQGLSEREIFFICAGVVLVFGTLCFFLFWCLVLPFIKQRWSYREFGGRRTEETTPSPPTAVFAEPSMPAKLPMEKI